MIIAELSHELEAFYKSHIDAWIAKTSISFPTDDKL
jgi:hypothetical protein